MPDSYFSPLSNVLSSATIQSIASHFGVPEQTILGGVHSSMAAIVSGLAQRSSDRGFIGQLIQMASSTPENAVSSALSSDVLTNPNSSTVSGANQLLSSVFGGRLGSLTNAVSGQTGLGAGATSSLLSLAGTTVLGLLGKKLRDGSLNASSLPGFLQSESHALQGYVPRGFGIPAAAPAGVGTHKVDVDPVVAQSVQRERHSVWPWLLPLLLAAFLLAFWGLRPHRPRVAVATPQPVRDLGAMVPVKACDGTTVNAPERGVETRLVAFIVDPSRRPDTTSWFDFDRLLFNTDSATLQPQSTEQLQNIATILQHCPNVRLTVGGYTDNTGDAQHNQVLSQQRADSVCNQLEAMGVAPDRLNAKGYGDSHPVADNSTPDGRAQNRRISMLVIQK